MPPRKPPKSLMSTCMDVISNSFLDITVKIEDNEFLSKNSVLHNKINLVGDSNNCTSQIQHELCYHHEEEVAKYIFSSLPSTLISLLLSQTMIEFATRWRSIIEISENKLNIPNTNGVR